MTVAQGGPSIHIAKSVPVPRGTPNQEARDMSKLIGGIALVLLVGGSASSAQAAAWCAFYDVSTYNCGFHTYEQCLENIRGVGGYCARNHFEAYHTEPSRGRRQRDGW